MFDVDKASYEIMAKQSPEIIASIEEGLAEGVTASQIETGLQRKYVGRSDIVNMAICAAYYLESIGKNRTNMLK